ncbi:hypothetical protein OKE80_00095 [Riemerella anatipestifer]|uniref:Uncharacterized protein n=1 Tax=Riemerella anatipestifer TaxID=34085 RepID=A0AAP3AJC6_RIEAN|nr:hypothetical protein [Riemerella anatipestifer]AZZ58813.1 hypothetical protein AWB57_07075 [Riemerella anatipestifer]MBT0534022.1 hypothetical protein [Riemerella anatipestifer]MBT0573376.1 hypothetical protein [Riemerella anatipestifer]MCO7317833.1 hypothetical protein [Riemerella anatipestifer]MCQ4153988.1 hypothetical protein [Riemerella anatipestifer]
MDLNKVEFHIDAYKTHGQILDAASFVIKAFGLEHFNFAGFDFREEMDARSIVLTTEGELSQPQKVKIPKNLFDFDFNFNLVLNLIAHEMLHVRQKAQETLVEDKNEREFQAYYETLFHKVFPQIPDVPDFNRKQFADKALEYYRRMGEGSVLQEKYASQKEEVETLKRELSQENKDL